jgi:hypothetical protein
MIGPPCSWGYKYGNLVLQIGGVSEETVIYGYGSCATLTSEWLHSQLQTSPLIREGAFHKETNNCQTKKIKIWSWAPKESRHQDELADWASVAKPTSTSDISLCRINIVTYGRVARLMNTWVLDWTRIYCTLSVYSTYDYDSTLEVSPTHSCSLYRAAAIAHSLQFTEHTHWVLLVCCPTLVLGNRLPTADVPPPEFPNCLLRIATATLDSLCTHWNSLLELCPITTSLAHWLTDQLNLLTACCLATGACNNIIKCGNPY